MAQAASVPRRVIVGISGASGAAIGFRVVELLVEAGQCEVHLVISPAGERTLAHEVGPDAVARLAKLATKHHAHDDIGASIASGSFRHEGMIIAPCSVKTLSAVAYCAADNLLARAADVALKERRKLVLLVRETPLHFGHLRAMSAVTEAGGIVMPPVPAFYMKPQSVAEIIDETARRAIGLVAGDLCRGVGEWVPEIDYL